mmetsp:Transcript_34945/g.45982  ORF Transcript_34945/g.45982 Transcript_34945/m.45982 type:complete len:85 (+) Transcript_34945:481-735(+)
MDAPFLKVRVEARLQILGPTARDLQVQHEEWLVREPDLAASLDVELRLQHAAEDVSDQTRFKNAFLVLLDGHGAHRTRIGPLVL